VIKYKYNNFDQKILPLVNDLPLIEGEGEWEREIPLCVMCSCNVLSSVSNIEQKSTYNHHTYFLRVIFYFLR
jgi:hypothetical protein